VGTVLRYEERKRLQLYVDGEWVITDKDSNPIADSRPPLRIGYAENYVLNGFIDEVRLYSERCHRAEVQALYGLREPLPNCGSCSRRFGGGDGRQYDDHGSAPYRSGPTATVSYGVIGGTATPGVDFVLKNGVLEFAAGLTERSFR